MLIRIPFCLLHGKVGSVTNRRKRILFYFESHSLLETVKRITGRDAEIIAANDQATIEAAIRLYKHVDTVLVERQNPKGPSLKVLEEAQHHLCQVKRILLASPDAISGVYEAVYKRVVDSLLFLPCREDQLRDVLGVAPINGTQNPSYRPRVSQDRFPSLRSVTSPIRT